MRDEDDNILYIVMTIIRDKPKIFRLAIVVIFIVVSIAMFIVLGEARLTYKGEENIIDSEIEENDEDVFVGTPKVVTNGKVYITGAVVKPGVYEITDGMRIEDVVKLAGGFQKDADADRINLAQIVVDQQHIVVNEINDNTENNENATSGIVDGKVNINTATKEELMTLSGVGEVTAENIINYRTKNGSFGTIEDIMNVSKIGEKTFENLKDYITVN